MRVRIAGWKICLFALGMIYVALSTWAMVILNRIRFDCGTIIEAKTPLMLELALGIWCVLAFLVLFAGLLIWVGQVLTKAGTDEP